LSMEVAAVSTRKRNCAPATVTWATGRPSQLSRWISSAPAARTAARNTRTKKLWARLTPSLLAKLGNVVRNTGPPVKQKHDNTKTNVRAIIFELKFLSMPVNAAKAAARPSKGVRTRESILRVAVDLASVEGLEGLTIGRLADELKMSKSGLFAH